MNSRFSWWPLHRRTRHLTHEPGAAIFQMLRIRLTLWYCGVLCVALVLFSVALYLGAQYFLIIPVERDAAMHAHAHVEQWLQVSPEHACTSLDFSNRVNSFAPVPRPVSDELVACYNLNGSLQQNDSTTQLPTAFLSNSLARVAIQTGQPATDIIDGGSSIGQIYRYALAVPSPTGNTYTGVVLIGESVQSQENALSLLLTLLISVGGIALFGAGVGGLFLANRALAPARLAWTHQQRFIADASHELRTPLTLLRADAEVLLRSRERLGAEDAALLEDIVAEASHMTTLANNMLTLARLDNYSSHREHEVVNLANVARTGVRRIQALANQMEINIQVELDETAIVIGDLALLEQVVLVLLDNAIKYNRQGGHVIMHTAVQDERALLEVRDTGIGIATEHLPHLGERFYRIDKDRSRQAGGNGLGLSIAHRIIATHGGTLTMTSTPNQGTTVTILLPQVHKAVPRPNDVLGSIASPPERDVGG